MTDIVIHAVNFTDEVVSIAYAESREQSKAVGIARTMYLTTDDFGEQLAEIIDGIRDLVDQGLLLLRNPPQKARSHVSEGIAARRVSGGVDAEGVVDE